MFLSSNTCLFGHTLLIIYVLLEIMFLVNKGRECKGILFFSMSVNLCKSVLSSTKKYGILANAEFYRKIEL